MKKLLLSIILAIGMTSVHAWQPKKEITIVAGFPTGGNVDNIARIIAEAFTQQGFTTIVVNQPGAQGAIAASRIAQSTPDGHILMLTSTSFMFNKLVKNPAATYDMFKDFTHLRVIGTVENRVYANPNNVSGNIDQVIDDLRNGRKNYTWGSSNPVAEFTIRLIDDHIKKSSTVVPYNGNPPMLADLISGRLDLVIDSGTSPLNQYVESGKVKLLATTNPKTVGQITVDQYLPGIITHSWFGLSLPANAPDDIVNFYNNLITKSINRPEIKTKLLKLGLTPPNSQSTLLASVIARDLVKYQPTASRIIAK